MSTDWTRREVLTTLSITAAAGLLRIHARQVFAKG